MLKRTWQKMIIGGVSPAAIAFGIAFGTFVALLPTFGFSILLAIGLVALFPKINKPAVLIALAFWNPLMQIPVYALSYELGSIIFAGASIIHYDFELLNHLYSFTRRLLVGHLIVITGITTITYLLSYFIASFAPIIKTTLCAAIALPAQIRIAREANSQ